MTKLEHITLSEFESLARCANLPPQTRLTVTVEDDQAALQIVRHQEALEAMRKLRGSGNGRLVRALLEERARDKTL